jgi:hypothetical protein
VVFSPGSDGVRKAPEWTLPNRIKSIYFTPLRGARAGAWEDSVRCPLTGDAYAFHPANRIL